MKNKILIIISIVVLLIIVIWFSGIIPKQIGKTYAIQYMKNVFPEMQLEFVNIEWNKYFGDYTITFKDKEDKSYGCVIGPKYFPINIGQGLNAIQETYLEKYKEPELIEQKIVVSTFMVNNANNENVISSEDLKVYIKMLNSFKAIMNSNHVQNKVKEKYYNANNVELEVVEDTGIFKVIYVCDNHSEKECIEIVNEYIKAFSKSVVEVYKIEGISIIDSASISTRLIEK